MKKPLWELLIETGFFSDRDTASRWIMAGKVYVDDKRVDKAGTHCSTAATIRVKGLHSKYVSRGGIKLEGALNDFSIDVSGHVVLDVGASTGGFTDYLLQRGAAKVYAVDVGYGQLAGKLKVDPCVVNMERTNIGDLSPCDLCPPPSSFV